YHETLENIGPDVRQTWSFLEHVSTRNVQKVDAAYTPRICRHGFELIQRHDKKIVVNNCPEAKGSKQELSEGFLAVCNFFVASNGGKRCAKKLQRRKSEKDQAESV
ncbi:unnamed protein product, partial [Scytosiphon promiscuus]